MADLTNNPEAVGQRTAAAATNAAAQAQAAVNAAAAAVASVEAITNTLGKITAKLDASGKSAETLQKKYRELNSEFRVSATYIDDILESTKSIVDLQRRMTGLRHREVTSYKEAAQWVDELRKNLEYMSKNGRVSRDVMSLLTREINEAKKATEALSKETGAFSQQRLDEVVRPLDHLGRQMSQLQKSVKGVRLTGLQHDIGHAADALKHLLGIRTDRMERLRSFGAVGSGLKAAHQARREGRHGDFQNLRKQLEEDLLMLGLDWRKGTYDVNRVQSPNHAAKLAREAAKKRGVGWLGARLMGRAARAEERGEEPGFFTRTGLTLAARGEGSIGRGALSTGAGMVGDMAGGVAEAAGTVALPLIGAGLVLKLLQSIFDKNAHMSAEVEQKLGGGGIFAGAQSPIEGLRILRQNLNGPLISPYGIGYEKNIGIAQAITQAGLSTSGLAEHRTHMNDNGVLGGPFGTYQRNAYMYGRLAGLNPDETTARTIKLVTQYNQSLSSTEDFFIRINKLARTAGITTASYLRVLDDVTAHFAKANQLLDTTVGIMRMLSLTGQKTAEDIKNAMDVLNNNGQTQDDAVRTYLNAKFLEHGGGSKMADFYNRQIHATAAQYAQNLGPGFSEKDILQYVNSGPAGLLQLRNKGMDMFKGGSMADQQKRLQVGQMVDALTRLRDRRNGYRDAQNNPNHIAGAMQIATMRDMLGGDQMTNTVETIQSFQSALKQFGYSLAGWEGKDRGKISGDMRFSEILKTFQRNPEQMQQMDTLLQSAAMLRRTWAQKAQVGLSPDMAADMKRPASQQSTQTRGFLRAIDEIYNSLLADKNSGFKGGKDKHKALAEYANNPKTQQAMAEALLGNSNLISDFANPDFMDALKQNIPESGKQKEEDKARQLQESTASVMDWFKNVFPSLFNKLLNLTDLIVEGIDLLTGNTKSADSGKSAMSLLNSGMLDQADSLILQSTSGKKHQQLEALKGQLLKTTGEEDKQKILDQMKSIDPDYAALWTVLSHRNQGSWLQTQISDQQEAALDNVITRARDIARGKSAKGGAGAGGAGQVANGLFKPSAELKAALALTTPGMTPGSGTAAVGAGMMSLINKITPAPAATPAAARPQTNITNNNIGLNFHTRVVSDQSLSTTEKANLVRKDATAGGKP